MIRSLVKDAAAQAISWTRLDAVARATLHRDVPYVIAYHRVVERLGLYDGFALPSMEISAAMLEKHLDWLGRHFRIISLDDLATEMNAPVSKPLAAVTFDDGYCDVFHHGFPLLKRKGIPAAFFVVTDLVGTTELPVHERLHALLAENWPRWTAPRRALTELLHDGIPEGVQDPFVATQYLLRHLPHGEVERLIAHLAIDARSARRRPMALQQLTWKMLATMHDSGMTIGSHGRTHAFLTNESPERIQDEADISRREIERRLGTEVTCFAYPGGTFNGNVVRAVDRAGYRFGFTICPHRDPQQPMLTIPRRGLWERSSLDFRGRFSEAIMSCHSAGAFNRFSACTATH